MRIRQFAIPFVLLSSLLWISGCGPSAVEQADRLNTFTLMTAAAKAHGAGRVEDAGYLFLVGQARFQIDKQVYPPKGQGGNSPGVLQASLSAVIGGEISKTLAADPKAFANVLARLNKWSPTFGANYDPGWKYTNALQGAAADAVVAAVRKEILAATQGKVKLAENPEYVKLAAEMGKANEVSGRYMAAVEKNKNFDLVPPELKKEYEEAMKARFAAAKRMKEIEWEVNPESRWHARLGWNAKDFFDDAQVVALCQAIEQNNVPEMERLIAAGANANAVGKDGMTPLLWAFPEGKLERFECLLKHGADPNVVIQSDFDTKQEAFHPSPVGPGAFNDRGCHAGHSVTLLAARSPIIEYMKLVFEHGGNPNQFDGKTKEAPLDLALDRSFYNTVQERVDLLIAKGADLNRYCEYKKAYPTMEAVKNNHYGVALTLLKAGADPSLYQPDDLWKLTHLLVRNEKNAVHLKSQRKEEYQALIDWLEEHGETLEDARKEQAELDLRFKKALEPKDYPPIRKKIIEEREKRELTKRAAETGNSSAN